MSYVIYNKETTIYLTTKQFKTAAAAKAHLTRRVKKDARRAELREVVRRHHEALGFREAIEATIAETGCSKREAYNADNGPFDPINADDYAIADAIDFHDNIEKTVKRVNIMNGAEIEERANTPYFCSPSSESYWSM